MYKRAKIEFKKKLIHKIFKETIIKGLWNTSQFPHREKFGAQAKLRNRSNEKTRRSV